MKLRSVPTPTCGDPLTAEGAEMFARALMFRSKLQIEVDGALSASSFLIAALSGGGPWVGEMLRGHVPVAAHQRAVAAQARHTRVVGVLTIYESKERLPAGRSSSSPMNELLEMAGGGLEAEQPAVLAIFEHLRFKPRVRVWAAPVMMVEGKRTVGEFAEMPEHPAASGPYGRMLTFYC